MKTIEEWFSSLPPDIREKAMNNVRNQRKEHLIKEKVKNLRHALMAAFVWAESEEGIRFWIRVTDQHGDLKWP